MNEWSLINFKLFKINCSSIVLGTINHFHFALLFVFTPTRYRIVFYFFAILFYFYGANVNEMLIHEIRSIAWLLWIVTTFWHAFAVIDTSSLLVINCECHYVSETQNSINNWIERIIVSFTCYILHVLLIPRALQSSRLTACLHSRHTGVNGQLGVSASVTSDTYITERMNNCNTKDLPHSQWLRLVNI